MVGGLGPGPPAPPLNLALVSRYRRRAFDVRAPVSNAAVYSKVAPILSVCEHLLDQSNSSLKEISC